LQTHLAYARTDSYTEDMQKKALIIVISIVAVLVIAGGVTGALLLAKVAQPLRTTADMSDTPTAPVIDNEKQTEDPSKQDATATPNLSVDLGACTIITQATIQTAIGNKATVAAADNRGYSKEANGDGIQQCVFSFAADGSLNNRYVTRVTSFANEASKTNSLGALGEYATVSGLGEAAFFSAESEPQDDRTAARNDYTLYVVKDMKLYMLTIAQPGDADLFTSLTAQAALKQIAVAAKL